MPASRRKTTAGGTLQESMKHLEHSVDRLTRNVEQELSFGRSLLVMFCKGIMSGLGLLAAVVIVIPLFIWFLHRVEWIPLIGDFFVRVAVQMEQARPIR